MSQVSLFPNIPKGVSKKAENIRLLALDVDGVLSDGKLQFSAQGDEIKAFCTLDGHGIKMLQQNGITVAIITGRSSPLVARRARDLGVEHLIQGREDKRIALLEVCTLTGIEIAQCAYMGDDLPDLSAMQACGLALTVPNAHFHVKANADLCTTATGGNGAVREAADFILDAQGLLADLLNEFERK
jgi:3-deoxy-D-manno-octulosonate 8-phosphate phosphatase (KDO 8-P phosphatase)